MMHVINDTFTAAYEAGRARLAEYGIEIPAAEGVDWLAVEYDRPYIIGPLDFPVVLALRAELEKTQRVIPEAILGGLLNAITLARSLRYSTNLRASFEARIWNGSQAQAGHRRQQSQFAATLAGIQAMAVATQRFVMCVGLVSRVHYGDEWAPDPRAGRTFADITFHHVRYDGEWNVIIGGPKVGDRETLLAEFTLQHGAVELADYVPEWPFQEGKDPGPAVRYFTLRGISNTVFAVVFGDDPEPLK